MPEYAMDCFCGSNLPLYPCVPLKLAAVYQGDPERRSLPRCNFPADFLKIPFTDRDVAAAESRGAN